MTDTPSTSEPEKEPTPGAPAARGGAGAYIEGSLGAFYLLALMAGTEPMGLPGAHLEQVQFQAVEEGYTLDDLVLHGQSPAGPCVLEIQSKRSITFAPRDAVFTSVCTQVARNVLGEIPEDRHLLAVATQRTSRAISGSYQDVLQWARLSDTGAGFFARLTIEGVANNEMRTFVETFRTHLVAGGVADDDEVVWGYLKRFLILEFDFEALTSLARTHALSVARQVLAESDLGRAEALWSALIEISVATGKVGGELDRQDLATRLVRYGFHLAGDRAFGPGRARLAEHAQQSIASIGHTVAGIHLPRLEVIAAIDEALETARFIQIRGASGVGKSSVLRHFAERIARHSPIMVLDPVATPQGGWGALASLLGITSTAKAFLEDLALSGGVLLIDSLEMFTEAARQRTVNDVLRAAAAIPGFVVVTTSRPEFGEGGTSWLAPEACTALGSVEVIAVGELTEAEVGVLAGQAPELRALLAASHPAAAMARNLYRLSRLLKVDDAAELRTEAALAEHWWSTADGAPAAHLRAAQRILSDLVDLALRGSGPLVLDLDSPAREHLIRALSIREVKRDQFEFYHDVLRDWAVACRLQEDLRHTSRLDLGAPVSAKLARGIELAGRLALERTDDDSVWVSLRDALSAQGAEGSWRRQVLLAVVRSERGSELLDRSTGLLLLDDASLFKELSRLVISMETVSAVSLLPALADRDMVPTSLRTSVTPSATRLLQWAIVHQGRLPLSAIESVLDLIEVQLLLLARGWMVVPGVFEMLFGWLRRLDAREALASVTGRFAYDHGQTVNRLRQMALLGADHAPALVGAYLREISAGGDEYMVKAIRPFSAPLARVAARDLADLIYSSLVPQEIDPWDDEYETDRAFEFADSDYIPPSPAQPPFLDLLKENPEIGLDLIRRLVAASLAFHTKGHEAGDDGFRLELDTGSRFFPWARSYGWSRDHAREHSVGSALKALEAWGHIRLDADEPVETVLADVLGPEGACAAFVMVAVDLILSHWPKTRAAAVPYVGCAELLVSDRARQGRDARPGAIFGVEPRGSVHLADLAKRPSRQFSLEQVLFTYSIDDPQSARVRALLTAEVSRLGPYGPDDNYGNAAFMAAWALNFVSSENWYAPEGAGEAKEYRSPPAEAAHLQRMEDRRRVQMAAMTIEARISLAFDDAPRGSPELAREAAAHIAGQLPVAAPDGTLDMQTNLIAAVVVLILRDGDEALLSEHEHWVRAVVGVLLAGEGDRIGQRRIEHDPQALAVLALIYLWKRRSRTEDRDRLLAAVGRGDSSALLAFTRGLDIVLDLDPRLVKAATRVTFATRFYRWHEFDEERWVQADWLAQKAVNDQEAITAEVNWLNGGEEPAWPSLPVECPSVRPLLRVRRPVESVTDASVAGGDGDNCEDEDPDDADDAALTVPHPSESIHALTDAIGPWLALLSDDRAAALSWRAELVAVYSLWSATMNGLGLSADAETEQQRSSWNEGFYGLLGGLLLTLPQAQFDAELERLNALPDKAFCDISQIMILAVDYAYFNVGGQPQAQAITFREMIVERIKGLWSWRRINDPAESSIGWNLGGVVGALLFNRYNPLAVTKTYLQPAALETLDPLLPPLQPLMSEGPTGFVAMCTMDTLLVSPTSRHLTFVLAAVDAWLARSAGSPSFWVQLKIGAKVAEWLNRAGATDPTLLSCAGADQARIRLLLSRLTDLGIPEANDLLVRIEREA